MRASAQRDAAHSYADCIESLGARALREDDGRAASERCVEQGKRDAAVRVLLFQ